MKQATMPAGSRFKVIRDGEVLNAYPLSGATSERKTEQLHNAQRFCERNGGDVFLYLLSAANVPKGEQLPETEDSVPQPPAPVSASYMRGKIRMRYGAAHKCEDPHCDPTYPQTTFKWRLKSGRTASENVDDYIQLCGSCSAKRTVVENASAYMEAHEQRKRPVAQYKLTGEFIKVWESMKEAADALGLPLTGISLCVNHKQGKCGGFKWYSAAYHELKESAHKHP